MHLQELNLALQQAQGRLASDPLAFPAASVAQQAGNRHRACLGWKQLRKGRCLHLVCSGSIAKQGAASHQHEQAGIIGGRIQGGIKAGLTLRTEFCNFS